MEWNDPDESLANREWYFDRSQHRWFQDPANPLYDTSYTSTLSNNGILLRNAFNEDKVGFLWNVDHSTAEFDTKTCYATCHINAPTFSTSTGNASTTSNHWTNNINEKLDMWHIHLMQDLPFAQGSDEYQDWGVSYNTKMTPPQYALNGQGRHSDWKDPNTIAAGGPAANSQNLSQNGKTVSVPKWVIPSEPNSHYIKVSETVAGGRALQIKSVDSLGVLTLSDGSKIDPNADDSYLRPVDSNGKLLTDGLPLKWIPGRLIDVMTGGRGDVTVNATHNGASWTMKIKRALNTGDTLKQDVNFSALDDQAFGIAIFNRANNQHAIHPNLLLKFDK